MTFATGNEVARGLLAERFGEDLVPLVEEGTEQAPAGGNRARFIATMHALIAWFVAHPEVPVPWAISIGVQVPDVAALMALSGGLDRAPWPPTGEPKQVTVFDPLGSDEFYTPISISLPADDAVPL